MAADLELHQLAIDIVNAFDECESGQDRINCVETMIWNFYESYKGRLGRFRDCSHPSGVNEGICHTCGLTKSAWNPR